MNHQDRKQGIKLQNRDGYLRGVNTDIKGFEEQIQKIERCVGFLDVRNSFKEKISEYEGRLLGLMQKHFPEGNFELKDGKSYKDVSDEFEHLYDEINAQGYKKDLTLASLDNIQTRLECIIAIARELANGESHKHCVQQSLRVLVNISLSEGDSETARQMFSIGNALYTSITRILGNRSDGEKEIPLSDNNKETSESEKTEEIPEHSKAETQVTSKTEEGFEQIGVNKTNGSSEPQKTQETTKSSEVKSERESKTEGKPKAASKSFAARVFSILSSLFSPFIWMFTSIKNLLQSVFKVKT